MVPEMPRTGFGMTHSRSRMRKCTLSRSIARGQLPFSAGQVIYVDGGLSQGRF